MAITSVKIYIRTRKRPDASFLYSKQRLGFYDGNTPQYQEYNISNTSWHDITRTFTTNPYTSSAWQEGELEALQVYYGAEGDNRSNNKKGSYITWLYVEEIRDDGNRTFYLEDDATWDSSKYPGATGIDIILSDFDGADTDSYIYWLGTTAGTSWASGEGSVATESTYFPTEDIRVSTLIHRYNRSEPRAYTLEILLGGLEGNYAVAEAQFEAVVEQIKNRKFFEGKIEGKVPEPRITPAYGGTMEITDFTKGYTTAARFKADLIKIMEKKLEEQITDQERAVIVAELEKLKG